MTFKNCWWAMVVGRGGGGHTLIFMNVDVAGDLGFGNDMHLLLMLLLLLFHGNLFHQFFVVAVLVGCRVVVVLHQCWPHALQFFTHHNF